MHVQCLWAECGVAALRAFFDQAQLSFCDSHFNLSGERKVAKKGLVYSEIIRHHFHLIELTLEFR